jgi:hypothetical protein
MYLPQKEVGEREIRTQQQWLDGEEDLLRVLRRVVLFVGFELRASIMC